jgi:hypothetical protein
MKKTTQKLFLEGNTPLPIVRDRRRSLAFFGGALKRFVHPFGRVLLFLSEFWFVEINQGRIPSISKVGWIRI